MGHGAVMPRVARIVIPGCPHHITQRGNNRQDVFFVDEDRDAYLRMLGEQAERFGVRVEAYCLMSNHVHLVATPRHADSLAKAIGRTHWLYTQYVNRLHGRSGHLWQNRFFSCALSANRINYGDIILVCPSTCYAVPRGLPRVRYAVTGTQVVNG